MQNDVLIVGAGPTGLVLALWLVHQGVRVRIIDKAAEAGTTSRAMAVQARTLELYRQLDLAQTVVAAGHRNPSIHLWVNGHQRAHLSLDDVGTALTPYPFVLVYPQDQHERFLIAKLALLGVHVERKLEWLDATEQSDGLVSFLRDEQGLETQHTSAYVVGCDGAHSAVRQTMGASFPGGTYSHRFYVADVDVRGPTADGQAHIALDNADFVVMLPYGEPGHARLIGTVKEAAEGDATALGFADVDHQAIEGLGLEVAAVHWFSTYRVHHRVADRYRAGRLFLAGDAAHVHSPAGGQGMNTGIGDAINLAWKLAGVIKGKAPDALLDSYAQERRAFAEKLVATTDRVFTAITAEGVLGNLVRTAIAPMLMPLAAHARPLREHLFRVVSQAAIHYGHSTLSEGRQGDIAGGDRLPWLGDVDNHTPLSSIGWQLHVYGEASDELDAWCRQENMPLHVFAWNEACDRAGFTRDAMYLLRPDTYIAAVWQTQYPALLQNYFALRKLAFA